MAINTKGDANRQQTSNNNDTLNTLLVQTFYRVYVTNQQTYVRLVEEQVKKVTNKTKYVAKYRLVSKYNAASVKNSHKIFIIIILQ